ncbi:MAG TPA: hypothetical protein DCQ50_02045 [Chryseobacterium sp.]|nr:hypothetical protein [Chryseobacterium sp.]
MIYLTFDSNIWIYSLDESWQIENQLDYLEPWIQRGEVQLLLPKMIIDEWSKHEKEQVGEREKKLREFFSMAEEILPSAFFSEYKEPATQRKIIDDQLNRAKSLILQSEIIPEYSEVKDRIVTDGIAKKAPLHKKSSIADAIIVFSLIHYAKLNQGNHYFFISNNTEDFYQKANSKKEIHSDLKVDFDTNNIQSFTTLNQLIYFLQTAHGLKVDENINQKRKERIRNKVKEKVYNPEYDKLTESGESLYIQNLNTIEFILKETKPTKEQVIFVLALIDSDISYERDFYKRLNKASWFEILKRKGVFNPKNNPVPVQVKEGFQTPLWEPLIYLEKLSIQIKNGQELEFIEELISIINSVSAKPVDNHKTWYVFIKILTNLPKDNIPMETLQFIPIWLKVGGDTLVESLEICKNLLPKFLVDNPTADDIVKAELILKHLFSIEKVEVVNESTIGFYSESYRSRVYMYYLSDVLINKKLTTKIAANCSDKVIFDLAENIKKLRFDFPKGINITLKFKEGEYSIKSEIENENLTITVSEINTPGKIIGTKSIERFESLTDIQTRSIVISILNEFGLEYEKSKDNEFNFKMLTNAVANGSYYTFSGETISKLNYRNHHGDKIVEVFSLFFRDLLNDKVKYDLETGLSLMRSFALDSKYRLPFFKKVVLFVIGENWEVCKSLFWEIAKGNDPMHVFSEHSYENDLYELLNKNQMLLSKEEIETIQTIISIGPQDEKDDRDAKYLDYWQLRWYSALRNISPFKESYEKLSQSQNLTNEHYENLGEVTIRSGSVSPFRVDELLQKSNEEIVKFIHSFKPKDRWEEPTIDGLSNELSSAVQNEPQKFSDEIELYKDVPYIYAYHMANGFREAWKNKKPFNWEKVLEFYKSYILDEKFSTGQLRLENDGWGATADWVTGSVGNLLTEGMQSDSNAFDLSLLPSVKVILNTIVPRLKALDDFKQTNMDYPTYSLNSTAGKTLRTLLDYSLRRARNLKAEDNLPKWEQDIKELFEETFKKGIIDSFIITGWYFQQFYFLDKDWITNKVKEYYKLEDKEWLAFLSGFAFSNPPFNKDIYHLFYPHYERAIKNDFPIKGLYDHGIIRHIVAFYFWGFEDLEKEGLLLMLINKGNHTNILELVNFVWRQEEYFRGLNRSEVKNFEKIIFNLWSFLASKYENAKGEKEQKVLSGLSNLLVFVPELDDAYTNLVLKSSGINFKDFHSHYLIENLIELKDKGNPSETAKHIGVILNSIQFTPYFPLIDNKPIIDLVVFLYENGQKQIADEFCNKMARQGYEFLIEIHNKYKE